MISKEDFKTLVAAVRKHDNKINKLNEALDVVSDTLYEFPQIVMDYVEQQTGVVWTDDIWDAIYNEELTIDSVYSSIEKLVLEESV